MTERVWVVEFCYGEYDEREAGFHTPVHRTKVGALVHLEKIAASMKLERDPKNPERFTGRWEYLDRVLWVSSAEVAT